MPSPVGELLYSLNSHLTRWPAVPGESQRLLPALSFPKPEPLAAELPVLVSHGASRLLRPRRAASGSAALGPAGRGAPLSPAAEMSLRFGPCRQELAAAHRPPQNTALREPERRHCCPRAPPPSMPHSAPWTWGDSVPPATGQGQRPCGRGGTAHAAGSLLRARVSPADGERT